MGQSYPLPPALSGDQSSVSDEGRAAIRDLTGARPFAFLALAFGAWAVIIAVIVLAIHVDNILDDPSRHCDRRYAHQYSWTLGA